VRTPGRPLRSHQTANGAKAAEIPSRPLLAPLNAQVLEFPHGLQDFDTVIGNPAAPFLNKLASEGMRFTNYDAIDHPSEPNYLALFSGSEQGLGGSDTVPTTLFTGATLASELAYYPGDS
jgi:hypothetical protein